MTSRSLLAALAVACTPALADEPEVFDAVVVNGPSGDGPVLIVRAPGQDEQALYLQDARVVWGQNPRQSLPLCTLRPGVHVRVTRSYWLAKEIAVIGLGEHEFEAVVEDWVAEHTTCRTLPGPDGRLLEAMGAPCWQIREQASQQLRERGYGALRVLLWARRAKDEETRVRAGVLLRGLGWE